MAYIFTDPLDVKLIILFIIKNYKMPVDNGKITDIFMSHAFVDYFSMQTYLDQMVENGLVNIYPEDGVRTYVLTEAGEEAFSAFKERIPLSVREGILLSIKTYKQKQIKNMEVTATYKPVNELDYAIECALYEQGVPLLTLTVNAGSLELAKSGCEKFKKNPQKIYSELLRVLWE